MAANDGCENNTATADRKEQARQEVVQAESIRQAGIPTITNFTEKKLLKWIYELRDQEKLTTYTYIVDMNGKLHFLCESIGYGFPYSTQYSNPEKWINTHLNEGYTIAQSEPNGLFMPSSADGTWIIAATEQGPKPIYVEPRVIVSPFKLRAVE
jgi:hypothetical protein